MAKRKMRRKVCSDVLKIPTEDPKLLAPVDGESLRDLARFLLELLNGIWRL